MITYDQARSIAEEYLSAHQELRAQSPTRIRLIPASLRRDGQHERDAWAAECPYDNPLGLAVDPDAIILLIDTATGEVTIPTSR